MVYTDEAYLMKTIGLIGGMSWESTATYYRLLNEGVRARAGGQHSAELLLWSFDFAEIEEVQVTGDWARATERMVEVAEILERGGADCVLICTNTMHKMADEVAAAISVPLIHIADATAVAIKTSGAKRPLLLATSYTMEQDFYVGRLRDTHEIDAAIPIAVDRQAVHDIIYDELCQGVITSESKAKLMEIIERIEADGVDGVILGCTELGMLLGQDDFEMPVFDTAALHVEAALDFAL